MLLSLLVKIGWALIEREREREREREMWKYGLGIKGVMQVKV